MKEMFITFLEERKLSRSYAKNLKARRKLTVEELISNEVRADDWIVGAFDWSNTPEGHPFWSMVSKDWVRTIKEAAHVE